MQTLTIIIVMGVLVQKCRLAFIKLSIYYQKYKKYHNIQNLNKVYTLFNLSFFSRQNLLPIITSIATLNPSKYNLRIVFHCEIHSIIIVLHNALQEYVS